MGALGSDFSLFTACGLKASGKETLGSAMIELWACSFSPEWRGWDQDASWRLCPAPCCSVAAVKASVVFEPQG